MILIDTALQKRVEENNPVRVAMVGAGWSAKRAAYQFQAAFPGIRLVAIANRTIANAVETYAYAGVSSTKTVETSRQIEDGISRSEFCVTEDAMQLCEADGVDAIIEVTGEIEFGGRVAMKAIENGKHVILLNAELDATLGPILKLYAGKAGVIFTDSDGEEPGVAMNLYRYLRTIGLKPVLAGNLKGFYDPYRTPETQREFAEKNNMKPRMATSFVDGTKLSMELAVLANATGLKAGKRGLFGPRCGHVKEAANLFPMEHLLNGGIVDYVLGAEPGTGAFVVGFNEDPVMRRYLKHLKMGDGPLYVFYTPYHLPHLEVPITVARAVLFQDAAASPIGKPVCEVISVGKRDLKKGEILDGIGGFTCYGLLENYTVCRSENLLPMGLSAGCSLKRDIKKDEAIMVTDVEIPKGRLCDTLWKEQNKLSNG